MAAASVAQTKSVHNDTPFTNEQLGVYHGFLERFGALHIKNLSQITLPLNFDGFPKGRPCLAGIELEDLHEAQKVHVFGPEIAKGTDLSLVDPLEQTKLLDERAASSNQIG